MAVDFAHNLFRSLVTEEVEAVRSSSYFATGKWHAERNKLLDVMMAMEVFDLRALKAAFHGSPYARMLATERYRMIKAVTSVLIDRFRRLDQDVDPWALLEESRLLAYRGLHSDAALTAKEGIAQAERVHDLHAVMALREQLRTAYKLLPRGPLQQEIIENEYKLETVIEQVANLARYSIIADGLFDICKRFRLADDISVRDAMDALMADAKMAHIRHASSLPAQIRFTNAWSFYHEVFGQLDSAVASSRLCLSLWQSSPERIAYVPHLYREAMANLIGLLVRKGDTEQVPQLLLQMEQVPAKGQRAQMLAFCDIELQYQLFTMNTGRFEEAIARETGVSNGIKKYARHMPESKELAMLYNLGIIHLLVGNNSKALYYFDRIRNKGVLESRLDIQALARIFRLLLLLETSDSEHFHYFLRSNRRTFKKHLPFYRLESLMYKWLRKHQYDFYTPDRKKWLNQLSKVLTPLEQERIVGAEELRLWAQSRAKGVTMSQLLGGTG